MDARPIAGLVAAGRIALGAGLIATPQKVARPWIGPVAETTGAKALSAGLGARDVALGAGAARALATKDSSAREWLLAGVLADTADFTSTLVARRGLPRNGVVATLALAGAGIALGLWTAAALD